MIPAVMSNGSPTTARMNNAMQPRLAELVALVTTASVLATLGSMYSAASKLSSSSSSSRTRISGGTNTLLPQYWHVISASSPVMLNGALQLGQANVFKVDMVCVLRSTRQLA